MHNFQLCHDPPRKNLAGCTVLWIQLTTGQNHHWHHDASGAGSPPVSRGAVFHSLALCKRLVQFLDKKIIDAECRDHTGGGTRSG